MIRQLLDVNGHLTRKEEMGEKENRTKRIGERFLCYSISDH